MLSAAGTAGNLDRPDAVAGRAAGLRGLPRCRPAALPARRAAALPGCGPIFGTSMARERHLWDIDGPTGSRLAGPRPGDDV